MLTVPQGQPTSTFTASKRQVLGGEPSLCTWPLSRSETGRVAVTGRGPSRGGQGRSPLVGRRQVALGEWQRAGEGRWRLTSKCVSRGPNASQQPACPPSAVQCDLK